jgi:hypothetical protein
MLEEEITLKRKQVLKASRHFRYVQVLKVEKSLFGI